jgi:translocation and assembly module TamA
MEPRWKIPRRTVALRVVQLAALALPLAGGMARAEVDLQGLSRTTDAAVRATLGLVREACDAPPARVRRLYRRADDEIRMALEVYGYYSPVITRSLRFDAKCWQAKFVVVRGPRTRLREVRVALAGDGSDDRELRALVAAAPLKSGDGLNQRRYDEFKERVTGTATRRGYFDGEFTTSRIAVYPEQAAADVTLEFRPGERYRFGEVVFDQDVLTGELSASYLEFERGDPYDADQISDLYAALFASGYFQGVDIRTENRPAPDRDVIVTITLTPARPRTWSTGIGYATDTGPKIRMDYLNRRRNDRGHQLEFTGTAAEIIGDVAASYRLPLGSPRDEWLSLNAGYRYERPDENRSDLYRIGAEQVLRRGARWLESRFVNYSQERFKVGQERGTSNLVVPGLGWATRTLGRMQVRPRTGYVLNLRVSGTTEAIGSDTEFLQAEVSGRFIVPLWSTARLQARAEVGATAKDRFSDLPFSVRYFAGGDYSVRGYDYKALGPRDAAGAVIGGSHKLTGSLEIDQRLLERWSIAAFVDAGNAFDAFAAMKLKTSVGGGVRWYSPLGPIRFDIGVPLDRDAPDSFRVHITLGPDL